MRLILKISLLLVCCSVFATEQAGDYKVKAGIIQKVDNYPTVTEVTNNIPFKTIEEGMVFGFEILPSDNKPYTLYSVSYLPEEPSEVHGYDKKSVNKKNYEKGFKSKVREVTGVTHEPFFLNEGDPEGEYIIELYINDELYRKISFNVRK